MKFLLLTGLYLLMATTFGIAKLVLAYGHPLFIIAARMTIAGVVLLAISLQQSKYAIRLNRKDWAIFAQLTFFHIYCAFISEFWALQYVSAAKASLMYSLSPCVSAGIDFFYSGKMLTRSQFVGLGIGMLGFIISAGITEITGLEGSQYLPEIALLISVISSCYGWILLRMITADLGYPLLYANGIAMLMGGLLSFMTLIFIPGSWVISLSDRTPIGIEAAIISYFGIQTGSFIIFLFYILALVLAANIIFYNMYGYLLQFYSPTLLSFFGFTTPLFAAMYDWLLFGHTPTGAFLLSAIVIWTGLYIFYRNELIK